MDNQNLWGNITNNNNNSTNNNNNNNNNSTPSSVFNTSPTPSSSIFSSSFSSSNTTGGSSFFSSFGQPQQQQQQTTTTTAFNSPTRTLSTPLTTTTATTLNPNSTPFEPKSFKNAAINYNNNNHNNGSIASAIGSTKNNMLFVTVPLSLFGDEQTLQTDLKKHFDKFGTSLISNVKRKKVFYTCSVTFSTIDEASEALKKGRSFNNSLLVIKPHKVFPGTTPFINNVTQTTTTTTTATPATTITPQPIQQQVKSNSNTSGGAKHDDVSLILKKDDGLMLRSQERQLRFQLMNANKSPAAAVAQPSPQIFTPPPPLPSYNSNNDRQQDNDDNDGDDQGGFIDNDNEQDFIDNDDVDDDGESSIGIQELDDQDYIDQEEQQPQQEEQEEEKEEEEEESNHKIGLCMGFCPEKEITFRTNSGDINKLERTADGTIVLLKKYKRNVADDYTEIPPDEIRPPPICLKVMDYMTHSVADQQNIPFSEIQNFIRDRTRSLRQDLTSQHAKDDISINIHERCTRFHIVSHHYLCELPDKDFNQFQNREQLNNCLTSLKQFYDDHKRRTGLISKNEPEFRSYYILNSLENNSDLVSYMISIPQEIFYHPFIQYAIEVWKAYRSSNYCRFFILAAKGTFLQACILHRYFIHVRKMAVKYMNKAYRAGKNAITMYPIADFQSLLMFYDIAETMDFIEQYRFSVDSDQVVFPQDLPEVSITPRRSQIILNRAPPTFQLSIDQPESVPLADYKSVFIQFKSNYNDASLYSKENFKSIESYMRQLQKNPLANQNFLKRVDKNNGSVVLSPKPVLPKPSPISKTTAIPTVLPPTTTTTTTTTLATTPIALNKNVPVIQSNPSIPPLPTTTTSTAIPFKDTTATTTTVAAATKVDAPISPFGLVKPPTLSNTVSTTSASSIFKNPTPVKETTTPSSIFGPQSTTTSPTPGTSLFGNSSNIASPFKAQEPEPKVESVFGPKVPASSTTTINNPTSVFANNAVASKIFPSFAAQPPSSSTLSPLTTTTTTTTTIATPTTTISSPPPSLTTTQPPSIGSIFNSSVIDKPTLNQFIQPTTPHTTLKDKASKSEFKTPYQKKPEKNVVPQSPMEFSTLKAPKVGGDLPLPSMDFSVIKPPTTAPVAASPMSISTPYIGNKNNKNDDSIFKTPSVSATSPMELSTIYKQPNRKPRDKLPFPIEDINKAKNTPEPVIPPTPQPPPKIQKTYQEKSDISLLRYLFRVWRVKNMVYNQQKDQIEKMKKELNSGIEKTLSHSSNKKINYSKTPDIAVVPTLSPIESLAATTQHVDTDTITPINIPYYIYNNINNNNKNHKHLYWKLVYNTCTDSTESQIITKQLSFKPPLTTSKYPSTSYLSNSQQLGIKYKDGDDKKSDKPISISIVKTTTINSSNSSSTRGISSLLFHSNYFESNDQSQLLSILKVLDVEQNYQRIPVVFIVKQSSAEKIDSFIYDNQSLWKRIVNAFKIIEFNYNSSNNIIQEILDWSSQHSISLPTIVEIRPISSVLESILQAKLNYIFKAHYQWPRIDYTEHQIDINTIYPTPQSLIDYFNSTIKQLSQYITDPSLESIQWPIGEFLNSFDYWNTKENFKNLQLALNSILIPNLPLSISNLIGCLFSNNNNNSSSNSNNNQNNNVNYKDYQSIQVIIESLFNWVSTTLTKDDSIIIISELKIILQEFNDNYCKNQYYFRTIPLPWHLILGSIFSFQISKIPLLKSLFDSQLILDLPNFNNNNNIGTIAKIQIDLPIIPSISPISKKRDSPLPKYSKYESNTKALKFEDLNTTSMDIKYNNNNNNNNNNSNNNNRLTAPLGTFNETLKSNSIHGTSTSRSILSSQIKLSKSLIQNNKTTDQLLDKFLKSLEQEKAKSSQQHQFSSLTNTINHHNYNNFTPSSKQQYQQKKNNIDQLFLDIENEKEKANQLDISLSMLQ